MTGRAVKIARAQTPVEIARCYEVMRELRPHIATQEEFDAHRFYLLKRMRIASHHFSLPLE